MHDDTTPPANAGACRLDRPVRPRAWLHTVRVCNGEPGELDEALSFAPDNFPFGETGLFEAIAVLPLYDQAAIDAAVAAERERLRALIADDASAMTYQTMGQYRSALLKALKA